MPDKSNISIILSHPQLGENIGAVARAMKNFSISDLRIISPRDGWPNKSAESASVGAIDLINNAKIFTNLEDAIADLNILFATSAQSRDMNKHYISTKEISNFINSSINSKIGFLFGRESSGLTNEEIKFASKIITINTNPEFTSLNIAHAVCIICYEMFNSRLKYNLNENFQDLASLDDMNLFLEDIFYKLESKNFFKVSEKKDIMKRNITNIFTRIDNLSKSEYKTLRGILKSLSQH